MPDRKLNLALGGICPKSRMKWPLICSRIKIKSKMLRADKGRKENLLENYIINQIFLLTVRNYYHDNYALLKIYET